MWTSSHKTLGTRLVWTFSRVCLPLKSVSLSPNFSTNVPIIFRSDWRAPRKVNIQFKVSKDTVFGCNIEKLDLFAIVYLEWSCTRQFLWKMMRAQHLESRLLFKCQHLPGILQQVYLHVWTLKHKRGKIHASAHVGGALGCCIGRWLIATCLPGPVFVPPRKETRKRKRNRKRKEFGGGGEDQPRPPISYPEPAFPGRAGNANFHSHFPRGQEMLALGTRLAYFQMPNWHDIVLFRLWIIFK